MGSDEIKMAGWWVPWARWLVLVATIGVLVYLSGTLREYQILSFALAMLAILPLALYKPMKQRFEIEVDGHPVQINLDASILGRVRMRWRSATSSGLVILGKATHPMWFETHITVAGIERRLMVWVKPYPQGFLLGRGSQEFSFRVERQEMCF